MEINTKTYPSVGGFDSGGGMVRLRLEIDQNKEWLINPWDEEAQDFLNEMPTDDEQLCLFGFMDFDTDENKSFKAVFKDGIKQIKLNSLSKKLNEWCDKNNLPHESADEILLTEGLTVDQISWLEDWVEQWEEQA